MKQHMIKLGYLLCCLLVAISISNKVYAVNAYSNTETKSVLFSVPDGGWSSMTAEVTYSEKYTTNGSFNTLNERTKMVVYRRGYAFECPYIVLYDVRHSNNNLFNTWTNTGIIYSPTTWDGGSAWTNYDSVVYGCNCGVIGTLQYQICCNGANIPVYSYRIQVTM